MPLRPHPQPSVETDVLASRHLNSGSQGNRLGEAH